MTSHDRTLALLARLHYLIAPIVILQMSALAAGVWWLRGTVVKDELQVQATPWLPGVLLAIFLALLADGWIFGLLLIAAGRCIARRAKRAYCLAIASLAILHFPFAPVIGVLSIGALMRLDVQERFERPKLAVRAMSAV